MEYLTFWLPFASSISSDQLQPLSNSSHGLLLVVYILINDTLHWSGFGLKFCQTLDGQFSLTTGWREASSLGKEDSKTEILIVFLALYYRNIKDNLPKHWFYVHVPVELLLTTEWWHRRTLVNCPTRQCAPWEQWIPFALLAMPFVHFDQTAFLIHLMVIRISKSAQSCLLFIQAIPFSRLLGMIAIPQCIQEDIFAIPNSHLGSPRGPAPAQQGLRTCVTTLWRRASVA